MIHRLSFPFRDSISTVIPREFSTVNKQLLDEVEHDIMNYQNRGLCSAEAEG